MPFCTSCGTSLNSNGTLCQQCVASQSATAPPPVPLYQQPYQQPYQPQYTPQYQPVMSQNVVTTLSGKLQTSATIWLIIGILQLAIGGILLMSVDEISGGIIIAIGVVNIVLSGKDRAYSAEILQRPVGIVAKYTPVGPLVATLLYNLIFGGIIAVAGSIYDFTVRNYAMSNQATFLQIEQGFVARQAVR